MQWAHALSASEHPFLPGTCRPNALGPILGPSIDQLHGLSARLFCPFFQYRIHDFPLIFPVPPKLFPWPDLPVLVVHRWSRTCPNLVAIVWRPPYSPERVEVTAPMSAFRWFNAEEKMPWENVINVTWSGILMCLFQSHFATLCSSAVYGIVPWSSMLDFMGWNSEAYINFTWWFLLESATYCNMEHCVLPDVGSTSLGSWEFQKFCGAVLSRWNWS